MEHRSKPLKLQLRKVASDPQAEGMITAARELAAEVGERNRKSAEVRIDLRRKEQEMSGAIERVIRAYVQELNEEKKWINEEISQLTVDIGELCRQRDRLFDTLPSLQARRHIATSSREAISREASTGGGIHSVAAAQANIEVDHYEGMVRRLHEDIEQTERDIEALFASNAGLKRRLLDKDNACKEHMQQLRWRKSMQRTANTPSPPVRRGIVGGGAFRS